MLAKLSTATPVRATFDEASATLGYDLWKLIEAGPETQLNTTEYTQPAMLAAGVALWRLWRERGGAEPAAMAGHSLGEFTALVCAHALDFETTLDLVRFRGQAMQQAVPAGTGAMAAIIGLTEADLEQACRDAAQGSVVEAVNFNAPGQVVIAGETAAVQRAIEAAKARGAKRAIPLPVSVPSHSSLMRGAGQRLAEKLTGIEIRKPAIQYISAVDAAAHTDPEDIRQLLARQLASPVRWTDAVKALVATGIRELIECGPGKVLTGLNKRIERGGSLQFLAVDDSETLDAAIAATRRPDHA
jgi:[acyl-carrier-protein] S-malonyltransferase